MYLVTFWKEGEEWPQVKEWIMDLNSRAYAYVQGSSCPPEPLRWTLWWAETRLLFRRLIDPLLLSDVLYEKVIDSSEDGRRGQPVRMCDQKTKRYR